MGRIGYYASGDYNAVCSMCGKPFKASQLKKHWQGLYRCERCWEPRQPQDFVKSPGPEAPPPWVQPWTDDFVPSCTPFTRSAVPGSAGPGCTLPGFIVYGIVTPDFANAVGLNPGDPSIWWGTGPGSVPNPEPTPPPTPPPPAPPPDPPGPTEADIRVSLYKENTNEYGILAPVAGFLDDFTFNALSNQTKYNNSRGLIYTPGEIRYLGNNFNIILASDLGVYSDEDALLSASALFGGLNPQAVTAYGSVESGLTIRALGNNVWTENGAIAKSGAAGNFRFRGMYFVDDGLNIFPVRYLTTTGLGTVVTLRNFGEAALQTFTTSGSFGGMASKFLWADGQPYSTALGFTSGNYALANATLDSYYVGNLQTDFGGDATTGEVVSVCVAPYGFLFAPKQSFVDPGENFLWYVRTFEFDDTTPLGAPVGQLITNPFAYDLTFVNFIPNDWPNTGRPIILGYWNDGVNSGAVILTLRWNGTEMFLYEEYRITTDGGTVSPAGGRLLS